jgi:hypothetical protein
MVYFLQAKHLLLYKEAVDMVQFIAGGKGEGKTKKLIDLANDNAKTTDGHIVFIDDDKRHIFDLNYDIRFVETGKNFLSNHREFIGFLLGVLSQDNDIKNIYVDGLTNIVTSVDNDSLIKLAARLDEISKQSAVDFLISINYAKDSLPGEIKALLL